MSATAALVLLGGGAVVLAQDGPPEEHVIGVSFMFDVTDLPQLAGYADAVFTGTVERVVETQADRDRTLYQVVVDKTYVGEVGRRVVVSQLGYTTDDEVVTVEHQPQLVVGQTYLLAGGRADHGFSVIGGPESAVPVTAANQAELDRRWTAAARERRYPQDVPRR